MKKRIDTVIKACAIFCMIAMSSCAAMSQKHKTSEADSYYEDLSTARPSFQEQKTAAQDPAMLTKPPEEDVKVYRDDSKLLQAKLDTIALANRSIKTVQGFRILVYSGSSSDESQRMRQLVYQYNSDLNVYTLYKQPSFRVKVGDFQDRIEASYILNDLKRSFPNAMIVPDQINLVR